MKLISQKNRGIFLFIHFARKRGIETTFAKIQILNLALHTAFQAKTWFSNETVKIRILNSELYTRSHTKTSLLRFTILIKIWTLNQTTYKTKTVFVKTSSLTPNFWRGSRDLKRRQISWRFEFWTLYTRIHIKTFSRFKIWIFKDTDFKQIQFLSRLHLEPLTLNRSKRRDFFKILILNSKLYTRSHTKNFLSGFKILIKIWTLNHTRAPSKIQISSKCCFCKDSILNLYV